MKKTKLSLKKLGLPGIIKMLALTGCVAMASAFVPLPQEVWTAPPAADKTKNAVAANSESIAAGKTLYGTNCKSCHGNKGKGDGPKSADLDKSPKDFTKGDFQRQSDGALFWKITTGRKPMPSFKKDLTEEQRWQVINYIRTLK